MDVNIINQINKGLLEMYKNKHIICYNMFIFSNLPEDIIKYILLYDEHFIMRNGEIISIIPKTDYRYNLLNFITLNPVYVNHYSNTTITAYKYYFPNLYNYEGRQMNNSDLIQLYITEYDDSIHYSVWIGRQYPKSFICNKPQYYYIENELEYNWIYTEFKYIRK